jgi:hypothetical protein
MTLSGRSDAAKFARVRPRLSGKSWARGSLGREFRSQLINFIGAPRSMKMGNTLSLCLYDVLFKATPFHASICHGWPPMPQWRLAL